MPSSSSIWLPLIQGLLLMRCSNSNIAKVRCYHWLSTWHSLQINIWITRGIGKPWVAPPPPVLQSSCPLRYWCFSSFAKRAHEGDKIEKYCEWYPFIYLNQGWALTEVLHLECHSDIQGGWQKFFEPNLMINWWKRQILFMIDLCDILKLSFHGMIFICVA